MYTRQERFFVVVARTQPAEDYPSPNLPMHANDTTNAAGEYDPLTSGVDIYSDLEVWEGTHHDPAGEGG